jgi:hypothetical protein
MAPDIRYIDRYYDIAKSHDTALALILDLLPEWKDTADNVEFVRFTDGITNTVCFPYRLGSARLTASAAHEGYQQASRHDARGGR